MLRKCEINCIYWKFEWSVILLISIKWNIENFKSHIEINNVQKCLDATAEMHSLAKTKTRTKQVIARIYSVAEEDIHGFFNLTGNSEQICIIHYKIIAWSWSAFDLLLSIKGSYSSSWTRL